MGPVIRRALARDAPALTRVAHAAKRHWRYPGPWIARWREALTLTTGFIERSPVYCAVEGARIVGFYLKAGARLVGEAASTPRGRTLPLLLLATDLSRGSGAGRS